MKKTWHEIIFLLNKKGGSKHTLSQIKRPNNAGVTKDSFETSNIFKVFMQRNFTPTFCDLSVEIM